MVLRAISRNGMSSAQISASLAPSVTYCSDSLPKRSVWHQQPRQLTPAARSRRRRYLLLLGHDSLLHRVALSSLLQLVLVHHRLSLLQRAPHLLHSRWLLSRGRLLCQLGCRLLRESSLEEAPASLRQDEPPCEVWDHRPLPGRRSSERNGIKGLQHGPPLLRLSAVLWTRQRDRAEVPRREDTGHVHGPEARPPGRCGSPARRHAAQQRSSHAQR